MGPFTFFTFKIIGEDFDSCQELLETLWEYESDMRARVIADPNRYVANRYACVQTDHLLFADYIATNTND